ncbi:MAG TPA: DUF4465 domain-containing protein, partial [Kiritimatiellia bacterium]|nr:DUF4465 domain-containing protein [Kiritimatiellia bacterium]
MRRWSILPILFLCFPACAAPTVVSLDCLGLQPGQYANHASFSTNAATLLNVDFEYAWAGFAFSTVSNVVANSYTNQYAAAQGFPRAYAVGYQDDYHGVVPAIAFDLPVAPQSVLLNNTTYAALTIRNGDGFGFALPFGSNDYFVLKLTAYNLDGKVLAATNHYLADFRNGRTFIQTNWSQLDLSWMPPEVVSLVGTLETTDMSGPWANTPMYFALADFTYAYSDGSDGIAATNPAFLCWADGWTNYLPGPVLSNQFLNATNALGPADAGGSGLGSLAVTGLGDDGEITLTFPAPIADGAGPDFAVFENAFSTEFLELAFVEVSSDGTNFVRFPNHCLADEPTEYFTESADYGGLAGKHVQGVGTPFDLRLLAGTPGLDVRRITHVRIVDVKGDGSNLDSYGNPIYDPTPPWGPGDFDLDAVGVLHANLDIATDPAAPPPALPG